MAKEKEKEEDVIFDGRSNLSSKASFIKPNGKRKEPWDFDWGTLLLINQWRKTSHSLTLLKSRKMKRIFFLSLMNYSTEKQKRERNKSFSFLSQLVFKFSLSSLFCLTLASLSTWTRLLEVFKQKKEKKNNIVSHVATFCFFRSFEHCLFVLIADRVKPTLSAPGSAPHPPSLQSSLSSISVPDRRRQTAHTLALIAAYFSIYNNLSH